MLDQENQNSTDPQPIVASETVVTNTDQSMISKSIETKAENPNSDESKPKSFLTKKKIIWAAVFFAVSLVLVGLTIRYVLKIEWNSFFQAIRAGFDHKIGILWFFLLLCTSFLNVLRCFITLMPRIKKLGVNISWGDYLLYGITVCFLGQVTPSSLITDPYTIFWMKTHGISTSKCASILFTNTLFWQVGQIILTLPPLIICIINRHTMWEYFSGGIAAGKTIYSLIIIGCIIDYIGLAFIFLMCVSKRFHYRLSCIFNWFKKKFHMKYHTKPEIVEKYKTQAVIKTDFIEFMKDWKTSLLIFMLFSVGDILATFALGVDLSFVQYASLERLTGVTESVKVPFDWGWIFICGKLSVPANRLNLLPGAALLFEKSLSILINSLSGWKPFPPGIYTDESIHTAHETIANNGAFMGRCFGGYVPALVGIGGFVALTIQQVRLKKKTDATKQPEEGVVVER